MCGPCLSHIQEITKASLVKTLFCCLLMLMLIVCGVNLPVTQAQQLADTAPDATEAAQRRSVREAILKRFPDLNDNVLEGWVDAYAQIPLAELDLLLEQRQQLPQISPLNRLMAPPERASFELPEISAAKTQTSTSVNELRGILRQNILHLHTPGHRRRIVKTELSELTAEASASQLRLSAPEFDFADGAVVTSASPVHVAIVEPQAAMFRLHSATNPEIQLLTRNGRFQRLQDGRLGLVSQKTSLVLSDQIIIPDDASRVQITASGHVTWQSAAGEAVQGGRISLAVIQDLSRLQSRNGVYFRLPAGSPAELLTMTTEVKFRTYAVELSNTVPETEVQMLQYLQVLE